MSDNPVNSAQASELRIGIDLGGTKTEAVLMAPDSRLLAVERRPTPFNDYEGQIATIVALVRQMEQTAGVSGLRVGIAHPGALLRDTGLIQNANSTCLNGRALQRDIETALVRRVRMANDADCLAVSEAADGAGAGAACVFAVILGTGVGGGIVINGALRQGPNAIAGEWGHNALPWPRADWGEVPGPAHWDGQHGVIESYLAGPGFAADYLRTNGQALRSEQIVAAATAREEAALAAVARYQHRLARALASVINVLDPDIIVLGGGLSRVPLLYDQVSALWRQWVFTETVHTRLAAAVHGDSSGVRGAAWLWPAV